MFDRESITIYVFITLVGVICLNAFVNSEAYNLKCIVSNVDGETYCVRDRQKLEIAADLLAEATQKCKELVIYCGKKYPDDEDVKRLVLRFNPTKISEILPTSEHTAYTENKGEKLAFCLNTTKNGNKLIDINTLTFVALHELAHVMTKTEKHTEEYWTNFKFLLQNAKAAHIYNPVDYKKNPQQYCGMNITDNPYYDFN